MKRAAITAMVLAGWVTAAGAAELPKLSISLIQAEAQALTTSARVASKQSEVRSATAAADAAYSLFWPKLSAEGSYSYVDVIPELAMTVAPGRSAQFSLGDQNNYSVGLQATWNAWDSFQVYNNWKAIESLEQAKQEELRWLRRELVLKTRLAYFQAQLAMERLRLTQHSTDLAQEQYRDIQAKYKAGMASRKDALSSHLEVLTRIRQTQAAQIDLAVALRDLLSLTGAATEQDVSQPWYAEEKQPPAGATVEVKLDALDLSLERLGQSRELPLDPRHPQAELFVRMTQSALSAAESVASGHWPKVQVGGKSSLDYPNGPVPEEIWQNTLAVKASWSLWEGNRVVNQTREREAQAQAQQQMTEEAWRELTLAWQKSRDKLRQLEAEQPLIEQMAKESLELSRVAYDAYRAGRADYIDVQAANLKTLDVGTQAALNKVQQLLQLAMLESLTKDKE
jgi:outer membrane protein TolC